MQADDDYELFLDLPLEIQHQIITKRSDLLQNFSRVNLDYNESLKRAMFHQCNKPINQHENYFLNQPLRGTIHKKYLNRRNGEIIYGNLIVIHQENLVVGKTSTVVEVVLTDHVIIQEIPPQGQEQKIEFYKYTEQDYLSLYHIWQNRLSCMQMDPGYAKKRIIDVIDKQFNHYNKMKDNKIDFGYKNFIITIYCTLIMNKYIFNIMDKSKITKLTDIEHNIDDIKDDIENMFEEIRNRLISL